MPDGNLEYLGRIDEQVKIRGFRIELKEIENVIRNIDYVKDAAVITRKDASGENLILAYIVSDEKIHGKEIRGIIGKSLPEYMVPSYFLQIDRIPVTRNGKLVKGRYLAYGEEDAFLQTGSISFDASTIEIWATLLNGGKLVVAPQEDIIDCKKLKEQIEKHHITYLWITATLFNQMIQADVTVFDSLKYVMTGGEKISDKHVKMLREHNASIQIINGYGPRNRNNLCSPLRHQKNLVLQSFLHEDK